jgi:hypothetical protein
MGGGRRRGGLDGVLIRTGQEVREIQRGLGIQSDACRVRNPDRGSYEAGLRGNRGVRGISAQFDRQQGTGRVIVFGHGCAGGVGRIGEIARSDDGRKIGGTLGPSPVGEDRSEIDSQCCAADYQCHQACGHDREVAALVVAEASED